jgi:hypothetical protein
MKLWTISIIDTFSNFQDYQLTHIGDPLVQLRPFFNMAFTQTQFLLDNCFK